MLKILWIAKKGELLEIVCILVIVTFQGSIQIQFWILTKLTTKSHSKSHSTTDWIIGHGCLTVKAFIFAFFLIINNKKITSKLSFLFFFLSYFKMRLFRYTNFPTKAKPIAFRIWAQKGQHFLNWYTLR